LRILAFLIASSLAAAVLPKDTEIPIRLTAKVSNGGTATGSTPTEVTAIVITTGLAIPAGTQLSGTAKHSTESNRDQLLLTFNKATLGSYSVPIAAIVSGLDNSRETVNSAGLIIGIDGSQTASARIDQGISKLEDNPKFSALAGIMSAAKTTLKIQDTNPNIDFDAGVEMTIKLTAPVDWRGPTTGPEAKLKAFSNEAALADLANRQPYRTNTENPPKPSDITNLMFIGTEANIRAAFEKAGWAPSAALSGASKLETARAIIESRGYKEGPMSVLLLDGHPPDMTWQKGNNTYAARHHLRIFKRPENWEGSPVWVSSSTHDTGIEFSERDRTFIHKIDSNIDNERSKVVNDLILTGMVKSLALVDRASIPKGLQNATGDNLITDGRMAVLFIAP
jgi:hypothetical protein